MIKIDLNSKDISSNMISRLTDYVRILREIRKYSETINSVELAQKMKSTAAQVRRDLSTFGEFGTRGKGYNIDKLIEILEYILGIDKENEIILIGYGKMGSMIASNSDVLGKGFKIVAVFDKDKNKIGQEVDHLKLKVKDASTMKEFIQQKNINQVILTVNKESAQELADVLVKFGIRGILNLTAYNIDVPDNIAVIEVDISSSLQELNFWRNYLEIKK